MTVVKILPVRERLLSAAQELSCRLLLTQYAAQLLLGIEYGIAVRKEANSLFDHPELLLRRCYCELLYHVLVHYYQHVVRVHADALEEPVHVELARLFGVDFEPVSPVLLEIP